ncbi:MAG: glycoside hydrolase [Ruminococcus sp.]|nr:glycoside hydrolase [Ruminococcus sp.]
MKKRLIKALAVCGALGVLAAAGLFLVYKEVIKLNTPSREKYPVRGVDVSSYQGEIDWTTLSQGLDFAYIKAAEGSKYADECFAYNREQARRTGLRVGAYHFFSFDSAGAAQAENFISQAEGFDGMLPPVIDVELYGKYRSEPKSAEEVIPELEQMVAMFEENYGVKPVFYATGKAYSLYIKDNFPGCGLWIRNVYLHPSEKTLWDFWQYSGKGLLDGYNGEEKYIDLNVFRGSREEFDDFCKQTS